MAYSQPRIIQRLNLSTQLENYNLGQPITKQCSILFSLWCKKFAIAIKEKTFKGIVHFEMKIVSITHPHIVSNP